MELLKSTRLDRNKDRKGPSPFWSLFILTIIASMLWIALESGRNINYSPPIIRYLAPYVIGFLLILGVLASIINVNKQWEETVILRLGKYHRIRKEGLYLLIPYIDRAYIRDTRTHTMDIPHQKAITKDNISVDVDAVMWYKISDTNKSVLNIENFEFSIREFTKTTLRNVIGHKELDELLTEREEVAFTVKDLVEHTSEEWGIDIERVELQDIILPDNMKRVMARQAEAERERRAVVIKAEGELQASVKLTEASLKLEESRYGYALRMLSTISDVSQDTSNTVIFVPAEALSPELLAAGMAAKPASKKSS
jgi:regulator of protease activity HflC (stomatin/prohibitin superfamily)